MPEFFVASDTFNVQYRHIEQLHKEFDALQSIFDKLVAFSI